MPSKMVEIKNNWHKEHRETVGGKEYVIPAGGTIQVPRYEGVGLMGSCLGFQKWDGDPKEYPYAKALDMRDVPGSGEMNVIEIRHPETGALFASQEALDAALSRESDKSLVKELLQGLASNKTTTEPSTTKVYACARCNFETPNKAAYLKHSETHGHTSSNPA
jgi:hypothetical protein